MNFRSLAAVPMMREGRAIGAIAVGRAEPGLFPDRQVELLRTFADQAVIAIENVRLFTELDARNHDLTNALEQQTATADVLRVMSASATDAQPVFDAIVRNAVRLCRARFALVYRLDGDVIRFVTHHNLPPAAVEQFQSTFPQRLSESGTLVARAIQQGEVINVVDIAAEPNVAESVRELARSSGYRSVLAVPIMREGRALGALAITRSGPAGEPEPFASDEIPLLQTFTEQAGIAIENVRLFNELEARTAQLTRSVDELQALGEVSQAVSSTLDLDAVLETIVGRAVQLSGSDQGVAYEFDEAARTFLQRATHRMTAEYVETMRAAPIRLGEGAIGRAGVTRAPVQVADIQHERRARRAAGAPAAPRAGHGLAPRRAPGPGGPPARRPGDHPSRARRLLARRGRDAADLRDPVGARHPERPPVPGDPASEAVRGHAPRDEPGGHRHHGSQRHRDRLEPRGGAALRLPTGRGPRPRHGGPDRDPRAARGGPRQHPEHARGRMDPLDRTAHPEGRHHRRRRDLVAAGDRRRRQGRHDRDLPRHHRAPAGPAGGGGGQRGQGRLPGHHEPRDPHPDERGDRHERAPAQHPADRGAARLRGGHPAAAATPSSPSSTTSSTSRRSRRASSSWRPSPSTCGSASRAPSTSWPPARPRRGSTWPT